MTWSMQNGSSFDTESFGVIDNIWQVRTTGDFPLA